MKNDPKISFAPNGLSPGLYVHVPFCKTKCPYCDFYSIAGGDVAGWLDALSKEAALHRGLFGKCDTLYIGGGTPSLLGEGEVRELFELLTGSFDFSGEAEITIEANPDDVTAARLAAWRDLGINRVSLGVQSFDDAELRFMRRRHDAAQARAAAALISEAGFASVGLDLIYGFEGQSAASWERTMRSAVELVPAHLSCYQMTIEPATEFGKMLQAGTLEIPDEESQRRFFLQTSQFLCEHGYVHYEISNFARGEAHISRHNRKYWRHAPYLGLGPSAHSFDGRKRWWNVRSVEAYCRRLAGDESPIEDSETLSDDELAFETLCLGFRTRDGVPLETLGQYPGWQSALAALAGESLVTVKNGRAVPTLEGFCLADRLALAFAE
ncbi:MAG: radical SAM family heme chaperone HemW [Candidatus Krumholzibacteria bacterium]|nr:radical SAM family heme chaperone HemW [Candidatus Krumholzibacteria bacterium]